MEPFYLLEYLKSNEYFPQSRYDNLRYELDNQLHYYGNHFKNPYDNSCASIKNKFRDYLRSLYILIKIFQNRRYLGNNDIILSNAYFSVNNELKNIGYNVFCPSWRMAQDRNVLSSWGIFIRSEQIKKKFRNLNFNELLQEDFIWEINKFEDLLLRFFIEKKIKALFVPNDVGFFENLSIMTCRKLEIPSFIFLHGLPGRYNQIDENRSDYLIVWGEKIKQNYIKTGMSPDKIFVSGHPYYKTFLISNLKFSLENILIITKSIVGAHHSDGVVLGDRGNLILYLYSIERILRKLGVKSVRFRPHPSENENWYLKFINKDFFKFDNENLQQSIKHSSLIIGPTSTVFLESLYFGVNYVVYEPSLNNIDLTNCQLVSPFDGADSRIPAAKNEDQLEYLLKNKIMIDPTCFNDYISTPFDLGYVKKLIR